MGFASPMSILGLALQAGEQGGWVSMEGFEIGGMGAGLPTTGGWYRLFVMEKRRD